MAAYNIEQKALMKLRVEFVERMERLPRFTDIALEEKLLSSEHIENILSKSSRSDQIRQMLDFVQKKLPSKSDQFLKALMKSENCDLAEKLVPGTSIMDLKKHFNLEERPSTVEFPTECEYKIENFTNFRTLFVNYMSDIPTFIDHALEINLLYDEDKNKIESKSNVNDKKREIFDMMKRNLDKNCDRFLYALSKSGNEYLVGEMVSGYKHPNIEEADTSTRELESKWCYPIAKRGRVLIIENVNFQGDLTRYGSEKDREELVKFWEKLKYEVIVEQDLSAAGMRSVLDKEICKDRGENEDCFILFILSHGKVSGIFGTDLETISYSEIFEKFDDCPIWKEKPKLIYINACQEKMESDDSKSCPAPNPKEDFYVMYATVPDSFAYRHPDTGSRMIQSLMEVYNEYYSNEDVERMGPRTSRMIYDRLEGSKDKQISVRHSSLRFKLYLTPTKVKCLYF